MSETSTCINCGSTVSTVYCGGCGQKNPPKKINFLTLYTDFQNRVFGLDGKFPRTLRDLTIRPGEVALQFIRGNRVRYVGPVGYFFLTLTVFILVMQLLEIDFYQLARSNTLLQTEHTQRQELIQKQLAEFMSHNMRIFSFLQIPITGFFAWWFFRKSRYNYLEHTVLAFYASGHLLWLGVFGLLAFATVGLNFTLWQLPMYWAFFAFACVGFY